MDPPLEIRYTALGEELQIKETQEGREIIRILNEIKSLLKHAALSLCFLFLSFFAISLVIRIPFLGLQTSTATNIREIVKILNQTLLLEESLNDDKPIP